MLMHYTVTAVGQGSEQSLEQYLQSRRDGISEAACEFYECYGANPAWVGDQNRPNLVALEIEMARALQHGLRPADYPHDWVAAQLREKKPFSSGADSLALEIRITGIAMQFYRDLQYGNVEPAFGYKGLSTPFSWHKVAIRLATYVARRQLTSLAADMVLRLPELKVIHQKIVYLQQVVDAPGFEEKAVVRRVASVENKELTQRLIQMGLLNSAGDEAAMKNAVRRSQREYGLLDDGIIRSTYLEALNIPLKKRLGQLVLSLNYYRWLAVLQERQEVIVVNIPAAWMRVYDYGTTGLEMKMVCGKPSTPTPTLTSTVNEVILYPYWHVPYKIATRELLPLIKMNRAFLDQGNYQVLNKAGKIVDPGTVNWKVLGPGNFPYTLRQSTGCDNALGLIKLNFDNPYSVYLHDTPNKMAFMLGKRFLSHGCMRMEKPFELARDLLPVNHIAI